MSKVFQTIGSACPLANETHENAQEFLIADLLNHFHTNWIPQNGQDLLSSTFTLEVLNNSSHEKLSWQISITHIDFNTDLLIQKYYNLKSSRFQQSSGKEKKCSRIPSLPKRLAFYTLPGSHVDMEALAY